MARITNALGDAARYASTCIAAGVCCVAALGIDATHEVRHEYRKAPFDTITFGTAWCVDEKSRRSSVCWVDALREGTRRDRPWMQHLWEGPNSDAELAARHQRMQSRILCRLAALAAVVSGVAIGAYSWYWQRLQWPTAHGWPAAIVQGEATLDGRVMAPSQSLSPGSVLETGERGVAKLQVARIGEVVLGRDSRLRLTVTRSGQHRVQLERGTLWARIWAPPGHSASACHRAKRSISAANSPSAPSARHRASAGAKRGCIRQCLARVLVPQGAQVVLYAEGPGTPHANDAAPAFVAALAAIDRGSANLAADADSVRQLVALSRREDAITLLSLLSRYPQLRDGPVF